MVIVGFIMTAPPDSTGIDEAKKVNRKGSKTAKVIVFQEDDFTAQFESVNSGLKNAFVPVVARAESGSSGGLAPNEFSTALTNGEPGWFYTGTVIVDEVPSALIENISTGEGMYLKVGEKFKNVVIAEITPTYIVVSTSSGRPIRMNLLDDAPELDETPFTGMSIEPVRPSGPTGPIGSGLPSGVPNALLNEQP